MKIDTLDILGVMLVLLSLTALVCAWGGMYIVYLHYMGAPVCQ